MKQIIAIILMVLAGNCFADIGDYSLTKEDDAMIEVAIDDRCQMFKAMHKGAGGTEVEGEYIKTMCLLVARLGVYQRFDDIRALPYQAALKKVLAESTDNATIMLNTMGIKAGSAAAKAYLGMNFE
ncbi:hypothetical protein JZM03_02095 [Escherichia coli]|uniref:hypothetical protein n=1 Tax=Escherichia coli TaxID=562 RepID=UPI0019D131AA|nr:hypothetical protein [Escherichia coli]MBN6231029.1 hypothetical protein [Escherichia coli]